jgi:alpha/beta superfamily hydrolase
MAMILHEFTQEFPCHRQRLVTQPPTCHLPEPDLGLTQETVRIPGPHGELVGELTYSDAPAQSVCLLANPHPHMGGQMDNYLIATLAKLLALRCIVTLRFDYSGVGLSNGSKVDVAQCMQCFWETGQAPEDSRMVDDVRATVRWLGIHFELPLTIIGYSFGAYAAVQAMLDDVAALVLISATATRHDFSPLANSQTPKFVIYSDNDFATPHQTTQRWYETLAAPKSHWCVPDGDHFYRSREHELAERCGEFLIAATTLKKQEVS